MLAAYGYVFINSSYSIDCDIHTFKTQKELYTPVAVLLTTIATNIVVTAMITILIYQGFASRKEQAIAYAIRVKKAGIRLLPAGGILPNKYHPFNKGSFNNLPGLYKCIIIILGIFLLLINVVTYLWEATYCCPNCGYIFLLYISTIISFILCVILIIICIWRKSNKFKTYLFNNYGDIHPY